MGILALVSNEVSALLKNSSLSVVVGISLATFLTLSVVVNVLRQLLFRNPNEPPVVFHWFPIIGSTISYGIDPYIFFDKCRAKYGDVFTFILLGKKTTVYLGIKGNEFILNGSKHDLNAEEVYRALTAPVFGKNVVYDCPNEKLMEQKKFVKFGLTTEALRSYVPLIVDEVLAYTKTAPSFQGNSGIFDVSTTMSEITIYTASRSLQGKEVRSKFDSTFADLYHDLDMGFSPINFMFPWAPLPRNRKRDRANRKMAQVYLDIINERKRAGGKKDSEDMIWNLTGSKYKNGTIIPDEEVANMMIALLMAGQHSSASTSAWILLRLAQNPQITEELYQEQIRVLGEDLPALTFDNLQMLPLNSRVVKETLRIHAPIHSIMRQVTSPMPIKGTSITVPAGHVLLSSPGVTARSSEHFPNPQTWDPHRWDAESQMVKDEDDEKIDYGYGLVSKGTASPYLPFGAGRHRCIGEQFAYLQLGAIIATMVRSYRFRNVDGSASIVETDYSSLFSQPLRPATIAWEKRRKEKPANLDQ